MGVVDELGERITSEQRRVLARALQCQWDSDSDSTGESLGSEDTEEDEEHDVGAWVDRRRWVTVTNNNVPSQRLLLYALVAQAISALHLRELDGCSLHKPRRCSSSCGNGYRTQVRAVHATGSRSLCRAPDEGARC